MSDRDSRNLVPSDGGFFHNIALHIKLVFRLLADPRVSLWLKILPFFSLAYLIFPEPIIGPIDDSIIIGVSFYLFIELCPDEVVQEHMAALTNVIPGEWRDSDGPNGEIVDADFEEID